MYPARRRFQYPGIGRSNASIEHLGKGRYWLKPAIDTESQPPTSAKVMHEVSIPGSAVTPAFDLFKHGQFTIT